jgi:hypothetical protein
MRRQQEEAIERRLRENEQRGIKNIDKVKTDAIRKSELERRQQEAERNPRGTGGNQLRVKQIKKKEFFI